MLSNSMDGGLPLRIRFGLKVHLLLCRWCRRYARQIWFLQAELRENQGKLAECSHHRLSTEARAKMAELLRENKDECA